jgi:hypothetical protein
MLLRFGLMAAALAAVTTLSACAPTTTTSGLANAKPTGSELVVENNNWQDMALYVLRAGSRWRVGSVPSFTKARFVLSETLIGGTGEIQLMADPIGSSARFVSEPMIVQPGQQVRFRLENNLAVSSYSVW